jgi:hypothetical protein
VRLTAEDVECAEDSIMATKDPFSIDISLRHHDRSYSSASISKALSLRPLAAYAVGDKRLGKVRSRWSFFYARLQKGDYASEFEGALTKVELFLKKKRAFWADFAGRGGNVKLILNHTIHPVWEEGDKCFELSLAPEFLSLLSCRGISLEVRGWQRGIRTRRSTH